MKKWLFVGLCLCLLCGCTATPTPTPSAPHGSEPLPSEPDTPQTITLPVEEMAGFDPYETLSYANRLVLSFVTQPLFVAGEDGKVTPVLAETYRVSPDGLTTEVDLRTGVAFHDGTPLTAETVVASIQKAKEGGYYGGRFYALGEMIARDNTVVFTTTQPYECFPLLLDVPIVAGDDAFPVGTGPYAFSSAQELIPSPYWDKGRDYPAGTESIALQQVTDVKTLREEFQYGDLSAMAGDPNGAGAPVFPSTEELWGVPTTILQYVGFNLRKGVFADEKIRATVTYAVDRYPIVRKDMMGFATAAVLPSFPNGAWDDVSLRENVDYYPQNLMSIAPQGRSAKMIVCGDSSQKVTTAKRIAASLTDCGITVNLQILTAEEFSMALQKGDFDLYLAETRLPSNGDLSAFFTAESPLAVGGLERETAALELCRLALANGGNAYDLQKKILSEGLICPVAFKTTVLCLKKDAFRGISPQLGGWIF